MGLLSNYKTYIAAAGLLGLSVYQVSTGQYQQAVTTFLGGLAATGLRHAISKSSTNQVNALVEMGAFQDGTR